MVTATRGSSSTWRAAGPRPWYFRARVRGSDPKDMPLGRWPDVTIGEARKRKSAIVASISDGGNPWQERAEERRRKAGSTLNEAFSEWLETVACNKRTRDQDELRYAMNIRGGHRFVFGKWKGRTNKTGIGHLPIAEITRLDPASTVPPLVLGIVFEPEVSVLLYFTTDTYPEVAFVVTILVTPS